MNYKLVKIASFYTKFLDNYYSQNKSIREKTYDEQYIDIMNKGFGWANFFQTHLNEMGNEAYEIIYNAEPLQDAWAYERGIKKRGDDLLIEQLKYLKPEVVLFQDSMHFSPDWIVEIKRLVPSIKLTIGWCCSPFKVDHLRLFSKFDIMLGCSSQFVDVFRENGFNTYELNHAFESKLLPKLETNNHYPNSEVIFIGSFIPSRDFHTERINLLESLIKKNIDLKIYGNILQDNLIKSLMTRMGYVTVNFLSYIGLAGLVNSSDKLKKIANLTGIPERVKFSKAFIDKLDNSNLFGLEMLRAVAKSKIGLNIHGGVAGSYAANIRLFEITGAGACLITDWKKNIDQFFNVDEEIITYKSIDECAEKIAYLLSHDEERKMIAEAGRKRTLNEHTFQRRAQQLNEIIINNIRT